MDDTNLYLYLDELRSEVGKEFTESVIEVAKQAWVKLSNYFQDLNLCLEIPDVCVGYQDNIMFTWLKEEHYLECEIFGDGRLEFFYHNCNDDFVWGEDITLHQPLSNLLIRKLYYYTLPNK